MQLNSNSKRFKVSTQLILQALEKMRLPGEDSRNCALQAIEILAQSVSFNLQFMCPICQGSFRSDTSLICWGPQGSPH